MKSFRALLALASCCSEKRTSFFGADGGTLSLLAQFRITLLFSDWPALPQKVERSAPYVCAPLLKFRTLALAGLSSTTTQLQKNTRMGVFFGADGGSRTHDLWFTIPALYQLSYVGAILNKLYTKSGSQEHYKLYHWQLCFIIWKSSAMGSPLPDGEMVSQRPLKPLF